MGFLDRLLGRRSERGGEPALRAPAVSRRACAQCERSLLPGMEDCPFCNARHLECDDEVTIEAEATPDRASAGMAGILAATDLARRHEAPGFLHVCEGPAKGLSVLLGDRAATIGRASTSALALADPGASSHHAVVRPAGEGFVVADAGSKNGTYVNGQRISEHLLEPGDVITCGSSRIYFGA